MHYCDDMPMVYADVTETERKSHTTIMYEVALSFAGEQRGYVEEVALALQARGVSVFYDEFEIIALWGKDLGQELQEIYERKSGYVVIFISKAWVAKAWPRHERRAALSRAIQETGEYLLPVPL